MAKKPQVKIRSFPRKPGYQDRMISEAPIQKKEPEEAPKEASAEEEAKKHSGGGMSERLIDSAHVETIGADGDMGSAGGAGEPVPPMQLISAD